MTPARDKRNRELEAYSQAIRQVASDAELPFVDLFEASLYLMDEPTGPKLTTNGVHLNTYGYCAISHAFYDQLTDSNRESWLLRIDANDNSEYARGVEISELTIDESDIRFQVTKKSTPKLRPPTNHPLPPQLESFRDTLIVENLKPGKYQLTVDEQPVASGTAQAWSAGVPIDSSPAHQSAKAYQALVNDKNLQFTYSWKALNQVHIVGERRTSPSGKELPKEVLEFSRLAKEVDKTLAKGVRLKTRQWHISRISK